MGTKRTIVSIIHDTGYGDDLLSHMNRAFGSKDMRAESIVTHHDENWNVKEQLKLSILTLEPIISALELVGLKPVASKLSDHQSFLQTMLSNVGSAPYRTITRTMAREIGRLQQDWLSGLGIAPHKLNHDGVKIVSLEPGKHQPNVLTLQLWIYEKPVSELAIDLDTMAASKKRLD